MSHLHKSDFCLNHAMAVSVGYKVAGEDGLRKRTIGPSKVYAKLLSFLEPPGPQEKRVDSFYSYAVPGHATVLSSLVLNGKNYVWYYNPWGLHADTRAGGFNTVNVPDEETSKRVKAGQIEDLKTNVSLTDKPLFEHEKIRLLGFRLLKMIENWGERGEDTKTKAEDILFERMKWSYVDGDYKRMNIGTFHPMSVLKLLSLATNSKHLVLIHPFYSVPEDGPQQADGIDYGTQAAIGNTGGACCLWSDVYMRKVRRVMTELLAKRSTITTEAYVLDAINKLTLDPYEGESDDRAALAKFMAAYGGQTELKAILSSVYDMIPDSRERSLRFTRVKSGENPRFHSHWHTEALWKIDLIPKYIKEALERRYRSYNHIDLKPECVAGYIEGIHIVSSSERKSDPNYLQQVSQIAAFVVENRLHSMLVLENFVTMLKILVSCKHDQTVQDNENARQSYSLPPATDAGKRHLQEHQYVYGYGANSPDSDFAEDTRKKRRKTGNIHTKF